MAIGDWKLMHGDAAVVSMNLPHSENDYGSRYDGRYVPMLTEITEWMKQPDRAGTYYSHIGSGDDHQTMYFFFSDPDTALEFKMRWVGGLRS